MSYTIEQAYAQIKQLENSGQFTLPETQDTIDVGTIDASTGGFTWSVPTVQQTTVLNVPPSAPAKPNAVITTTVGVVKTSAVDLRLRFTVTNPSVSNPVSIQGFGATQSGANQLILDAQLACSAPIQGTTDTGANISPPVTTFAITITAKGRIQEFHVMILRPPVLGIGAFTLPAIPITIVYAPPPGKLLKNYEQYADTVFITQSSTWSFTHGDSTRTAQAYTAADILNNISKAIEQAGTLFASAGAGAGTQGAGATAPAASAGGTSGTSGTTGTDSTSSDLKKASAEFGLFSDILTAIDDTTQSSQTALVTVENDHTTTTTWTDMEVFGSQTGLGQGVGDRYVYIGGMRVAWVALNGTVNFVFLGYNGAVNAFTAQALTEDRMSLASGKAASNTGLDADTIKMLLNLDPFCVTKVTTSVGPPLVGPPRFVPASPKEQRAEGTSTMGDQVLASHEVSEEDKQVQTNVNMNVTDAKPGWLDVIFGTPNVETTQTLTCTVSHTTDTKTDEKVSATAYFFSEGTDDVYDVMIFYDTLFSTLLFAPKDSPVLTGTTTVTTHALA